MSEQLSFHGLEVPQRPPDGLFFGLTPPVADLSWIMDVVRDLRASVGLRGRPLSSRCLHISMYNLGAYYEPPKEIVAAACIAAAEVSMSRFDMILDHAVTFRRRERTHPFVLRPGDEIKALMELHDMLGLAMTRAGLKKWVDPHFTPHMTLSYDPQIIGEHAVETVRWPVNELVLIYSLRGRGRNQHIHLARWALQ